MFNVGDTVLYGCEGVCKISEITEKTFGDTKIEYYILEPVFNNRSTFFVPTKNETLISKMHPILSDSEITDIINGLGETLDWIDDDNERKDSFREIVSGGDIREIASMLKCIMIHKEEVEDLGKRLHKSDEIISKEAQKVLYEEFALVIDGITKDDVMKMIMK